MDDRNAPASRGDIQDLQTEIRTEMNGFRTEIRTETNDLRTETNGLRTEMNGLRTEIRTEMDGLRTEMNEKIDMLRAEGNHNYHDLVERIDDGQTKLLGAFYGFIQSISEQMCIRDRISPMFGPSGVSMGQMRP